jgi:hypothetical protein
MSVEITAKGKKATVVFTAPQEGDAAQVVLTGEWDNWEVWAMKRNKDGSFSVKLSIDLGRSYQFGYSIDGRWCPDYDLPQISSPYGTSNSILDLTNVVATAEEKAAPAKKPAAAKPAACKSTASKTTASKTTAAKTGTGRKVAAKK